MAPDFTRDCGTPHPDDPSRTCGMEHGHPEGHHVDERGDWLPESADRAGRIKATS